MNYLVVKDSPPYDGRYEWDMEGRPFTTREWGWIKRLTGYLPLTVEFGDPEVIVACTVIALRRAGRIGADQVPSVFEQLSDRPFGDQVELEEEEEAELDPPTVPSSSGSNGSSGDGSATSSDRSGSPPNHSGTAGLASSVSAPPRLTT